MDIFTYICCENCNVCSRRRKINEKEAGDGPYFNIKFDEEPSSEKTLINIPTPGLNPVIAKRLLCQNERSI